MARATEADRLSRIQVRVEGTVQGVGFRPYVYGLANELALAGWVLNDSRGVLLEIEGPSELIEAFMARLGNEAPRLARVERVAANARLPIGEQGFEIRASVAGGESETPVSADAAVCEDCLREMLDPADRRHRYPFINCTNCGPRWTIVQSVPYDRPATTMSAFTMCTACQAEFDDPHDRRFHAQPNACFECGPTLRFDALRGEQALREALGALERGRIVAVKGVGGYHLVCSAESEATVALLRSRKHREEKPFALMAADLAAACELVELGTAARAALVDPARPIVIAPRLPGSRVASAVAPAARELGVMLPYAPLHHLLLAGSRGPLVMTSANVSDEPIAFEDDDAVQRLAGIADDFLLHDRQIHIRTDDSVVRAAPDAERVMMLRRSRGYVPRPLDLPAPSRRPLLACGAELKSTFCLVRDNRAWMSHHIGDLKNYETLCSFREGIEHMKRLFAVEPELVAHDLHPDYLSTRYALEFDRTLAVQHHHAHLAAVLAEHGELGPAVGAIYDGAGYGEDGTVWGGELLIGDLLGFERAGHLLPIGLPGGDRAAREPWRMACAWLELIGEGRVGSPEVDEQRWAAVAALSRTATRTSSVGRLFDAVAALCGVGSIVSYEGQAAIALEALADPRELRSYQLGVDLDPREMLAQVVRDTRSRVGAELIAARFHNALGAATARACRELAERHALNLVVLSGGCFQNQLLLERTRAGLGGLRCLTPHVLPAGDGGIAFGQAAIAAAAE